MTIAGIVVILFLIRICKAIYIYFRPNDLQTIKLKCDNCGHIFIKTYPKRALKANYGWVFVSCPKCDKIVHEKFDEYDKSKIAKYFENLWENIFGPPSSHI